VLDNVDILSILYGAIKTKGIKMAMDRKTKKVLIWLAIAVVGVYVFLGVKECRSNRNKAELKSEKGTANSNFADVIAHADSVDAENKRLRDENYLQRTDLICAFDSIDLLKDSIVVLNAENDSLKHANDSIVAELDDCKASKQPAKKAPAKKTPTVVKKDALKPMPRVDKPSEPVIIKQEPKCENSGSTTVNVNTPGNTVNISNGGIINNFFGDTEKAESAYQEVVKYQRKVIMGHAVSNESVRCK